MKTAVTRLLIILAGTLILASCTQRKPDQAVVENSMPDSVYRKRGDQLVAMTFDTLRNSLLSAIGSQGFAHAITFCNEQAYPLTTLYAEDGLTIRRASSKYRNPQNQPDSLEQVVLAQFERDGASTKIVRSGGEVHYIKPIVMQAMCLNCHGPVESLKPETLTAIKEKYPGDEATGYAEGDLRGIWHIVFRQ